MAFFLLFFSSSSQTFVWRESFLNTKFSGNWRTSYKLFSYSFYFFLSFFYREATSNLIAEALEFMYTPWPNINNKYARRSQLVDLIGDYLYFVPSHEVADIHSRVAPVCMYEFAYSGAVSNLGPRWNMGLVKHGDNVGYDFGFPLFPKISHSAEAADKNVSLFIMATFVNFAAYGNPTPEQVSGFTWERFNSGHRAYLRVDANPNMGVSFHPRRMAFWNDYYPQLTQMKCDVKKEGVSGASAAVTMGTLAKLVLAIIFVVSQM